MSLTTDINNLFEKGVIGNVRKAQEDSHGFSETPNGDVFVVCDGMGGHVGGHEASSMAVESILKYLNQEVYPHPLQALDGALEFANRRIWEYAQEHPELKGMGTTACIVLFKGDEAWIAHVGDSRIYLFLGKEKQLHRITKDHSFVQALVDAGQITDEEAEHHPNKNRILKALGVLPEVEPTFNYENKPIQPKNGDVFLICSDGLCGMINDATIERVLSEEGSLAMKGDQLIGMALEAGGLDNCTVELIPVDNSPWETTEFKSYNPSRTRTLESETEVAAYQPEPVMSAAPQSSPMSPKIIAAIVVGALLFLVGGWFLIQHFVEKNRVTVEKVQVKIDEINRLIEQEEISQRTDSVYYNLYNQQLLSHDTLESSRAQLLLYSQKLERHADSLMVLRDSLDKLESLKARLEMPAVEEEPQEGSDHSENDSTTTINV